MPTDNRNYVIYDLPDDPESLSYPEEDDDDEILEDILNDREEDESMTEDFLQNSESNQSAKAPWERNNSFGQSAFRPTSPWGSNFNWGQNSNQSRGFQNQQRPEYNQSGEKKIPRNKRIIFVDLLDILIESESAVSESSRNSFTPNNNYRRLGIMPRGLYDVRLKLEVFSKISALSPDYVFCITNQGKMDKERENSWKVMVKFVMYALADYLRLPSENCRCLTKIGFSRKDPSVGPRIELMKRALGTLPKDYVYDRRDILVIGANSGYANQSNVDLEMANKVKVGYIDIQDLLTQFS